MFLAGIVDNAGGKLVKDLRAVLGPDVQILSPDGFTPIESVIKDAGKAAEGVYVSVAGPPVDQLTGKGKQFVDRVRCHRRRSGQGPGLLGVRRAGRRGPA